jgi:uncharacterized delta-60 repeat protein
MLHRRLRSEPLEDRTTPSPAGDLDPAFGTGGTVAFPRSSDAAAVAVAPDGSVVLAGTSVAPVPPFGPTDLTAFRLTPGGSPDPAFGAGGVAKVGLLGGTVTAAAATAVAVQPDGKVVVAGTATTTAGKAMAVARLNPDGTPDPTFGAGGRLIVPGVANAVVTAVAVRPDGKVVLAGSSSVVSGINSDFTAVRLNPDGSLDPAFGIGGVARVDIAGANDFAQAMALGSDGRIVLAGNAVGSAAVAQLTPDGAPDPMFGVGGRVALGTTWPAVGVAVRPDGRIVLAGSGVGSAPVVQLTPAGAPDPTFGTGGTETVPFGTSPNPLNLAGVAVQPDGKVVLAGWTGSASVFAAVARLRPDGSLDPAFGTGGTVVAAPGFTVRAVALQPDGRVVLAAGLNVFDSAFRQAAAVRLLGDPPPPVLAGGPADGSARVLTPSAGQLQPGATVAFFPGSPVVARVAVADVTGDGVPDYVGGSGPGGGPRVVVIDGKTGARVADFFAFEPGFTGGVFVAAADLDGDGKAEVVVTPDQGGGPVVAVYSGAKLAAGATGNAAQLARFFGIDDPAFRGGARPAVGDVNGDGTTDLVVSAGFLGGPRIAVFDGRSVVAGASSPVKLLPDFFAFEPGLRNGAFVAAGDVTGDGFADLAFGGGPGGAPRVRVFSGQGLLAAGGFASLDDVPAAQLANFFAGDASLRGGVRLALKDADGDGKAALVTGSGEGEPSRVRVFKSANLLANPSPAADQELDPFGATLADGVFVG